MMMMMMMMIVPGSAIVQPDLDKREKESGTTTTDLSVQVWTEPCD